MQKWLRQNLTIVSIVSFLSIVLGLVAHASVRDYQIDRLNSAVFGKNIAGDDLSARLGRVEENTKDIPSIRDAVNRIEGYITQ